jgi:hypothetical protein
MKMIVNHPKTKSILGMDKSTFNSNMFLKENMLESGHKTMESSPRAI